MNIELVPSFVLHTRPFSDTSAVIECFTRQHGLLSLLAKGVKRPRSRWHSLLQPFLMLQLAWTGRGELKTLTHAEVEYHYPLLRGPKIKLGLYLNELLIRLLQRQDPHGQLFLLYAEILQALSQAETDFAQQCLLRQFERQLIVELGYGIDFTVDAKTGEPIALDLLYSFDPGLGIIEVTPATLSSQSLAVSGGSIMALAHGSFNSEAQLREAKKVMRTILSYYLGNKPLHSRNLYR